MNQTRNHWTWIRLVAGAALLPVGVLLLSATTAPAQPGKATPARVTIVGEESGAITLEEGGKKQRYVIIELAGKAKVLVATNQNVSALHDVILDEHRRLTQDFTEKASLLIQKQDHVGLKKVEEAFQAASAELLKHVGWCAADGSIAQVGDNLRMQGTLRVYDFKGTDKSLAKGKAMIEGQALHSPAKGKKPTLAISNADKTISVLGKLAQEQAKVAGTIRVWGVLRAGEKGGEPTIDADRIEVVNP